MGSLLLISTINLFSIPLNRSPSQIHNTLVLPTRPTAIYFGQAIKQRLQIRNLLLDSKKCSCC